MLKRWLAVSLVAVALGLSVGVQRLHAEFCTMAVVCDVSPEESECEEKFICVG